MSETINSYFKIHDFHHSRSLFCHLTFLSIIVIILIYLFALREVILDDIHFGLIPMNHFRLNFLYLLTGKQEKRKQKQQTKIRLALMTFHLRCAE